MKKTHGLNLIGTSLILAAASAHAGCGDKFYLNAGAGPSFVDSPTVQSSPFTGGSIDFNPGVRGDVVLGYNVSKSFALELDSGIVWNSVDAIGGNTLSNYGANADLWQVPLLVNGVYKFQTGCAFKPYVGVGAGVVVSIFNSTAIPGLYAPPPLGTSDKFDATDTEFAYQLEVGFNWQLTRHAELGLAYKLLGTTTHQWNANNSPLKTDGFFTHAIIASFGWHF